MRLRDRKKSAKKKSKSKKEIKRRYLEFTRTGETPVRRLNKGEQLMLLDEFMKRRPAHVRRKFGKRANIVEMSWIERNRYV